jgi:hypothetical protein
VASDTIEEVSKGTANSARHLQGIRAWPLGVQQEEREMSQSDGRPWEDDGDLPWDTPDDNAWEPADSEAWRGDLHLDDWPENLAGPEYWLYKKDQTDE